MLAARRDPILDHGPHDSSSPPHPGVGLQGPVATPAFTRFIAGVQILGTVLAIPLGLASGYSIYRANFSPEAKCGSLRANIISMLDKNADASTLRLLVRSDVARFEQSCGAVDPDAVAAFKTLLARPRAVAAAKEMRPAAAAHVAPARHVAHARPDRPKRVAVRRKTAPARHNSDADWLAAVRRALVAHSPVVSAQAAEAPVAPAPAPAVQPMGKPLPAQTQVAPPLPPATAVANTPAPRADDDHPVPPASIPNVGPGPAR